jgi:heme/copper-type cytochrome/quinol oxidase subunit 4
MDIRDWIVIGLMAAIQIAATVFVFLHPDAVNFATWATVCGTLTTAYHWLVIRDSKQADAA